MKAFARIPTPHPAPSHEPIYCTLGETLCQVRFWSEPEWAALAPNRRPVEAMHRPGIGYLAPVPVRGFS